MGYVVLLATQTQLYVVYCDTLIEALRVRTRALASRVVRYAGIEEQ